MITSGHTSVAFLSMEVQMKVVGGPWGASLSLT